jgi:hypothetical protein
MVTLGSMVTLKLASMARASRSPVLPLLPFRWSRRMTDKVLRPTWCEGCPGRVGVCRESPDFATGRDHALREPLPP